MRVLWLRPSKGDNISVRRERIAEYLEEMGVEVTIHDTTGFDAIGAIKEAVTGDYDIIAGNVRMGLYLGYPLARCLQKPFLGDVSDPLTDIQAYPDPLYRLLSNYEWFVLARSDAAVFVYESSFDEATKRGIDGVRLPNAVNFDAFADPPAEVIDQCREILKDNAVDRESQVAIYTGILDDVHHISDIVKSARLNADWEYVFVGEGPLAAEISDAAAETQNIHYLGAFDHELMPGFLYHADAGFCFKDAEQTLKLKEYAAGGLPILAQPGKLEKWYDDDELLFVEPNAGSISEALHRLENNEVADKFSENIQNAIDRRTWQDIAEEYLKIFQRISKFAENTFERPINQGAK